MSGAIWLVRRLGWLALAFGALVLTLWLCAARVPPPIQVQRVHYFPQGTT
ncbi:MAG: hypothetical protein ABSC63_11830 [Candidatus Binataceae bacterium]|jgi:hypothetical protein